MPELAEVETIVRYLRPRVHGRRIVKLESNTPRLFRNGESAAVIKRAVEKRVVEDIRRVGKHVVFCLDNKKYFLVHLMMTGRLFFNPAVSYPHDRMTLYLSGGAALVFNDVRKFGRCRMVSSLDTISGLDPLKVSPADFSNSIKLHRGAIKSLLMNQGVFAGIGNIYSDEILWHAGIHPLRRANTLGREELFKLHAACKKVLALAISKGGTSMRDYVKPDGSEGGYYEIRKVYQREGERCSRDRSTIKRIKIGQRSAHFCPHHQL